MEGVEIVVFFFKKKENLNARTGTPHTEITMSVRNHAPDLLVYNILAIDLHTPIAFYLCAGRGRELKIEK